MQSHPTTSTSTSTSAADASLNLFEDLAAEEIAQELARIDDDRAAVALATRSRTVIIVIVIIMVVMTTATTTSVIMIMIVITAAAATSGTTATTTTNTAHLLLAEGHRGAAIRHAQAVHHLMIGTAQDQILITGGKRQTLLLARLNRRHLMTVAAVFFVINHQPFRRQIDEADTHRARCRGRLRTRCRATDAEIAVVNFEIVVGAGDPDLRDDLVGFGRNHRPQGVRRRPQFAFLTGIERLDILERTGTAIAIQIQRLRRVIGGVNF